MQADRFTIKAQEAIAAAGQLAERRRNPQVTPEHLLSVLLEQDGGVVVPVLAKLGADADALRGEVNALLDAMPTLTAGGEAAGPSSELVRVLREGEEEMRRLKDEYVSTEHLLLALAAHPSRAGDALRAAGASKVQPGQGDRRGPRAPPRDRPVGRGQVPGAGEVRARPDRGGRAGQARPGHRARRRDPPRHPGPQPPHQEQPGAHRRARRGQDGDRRGPRPAHRVRRRARVAARPARHRAGHRRPARRLEVPRRVRGAPEGRPQRDQGRGRHGHPLHRRAAHDRRRRRRRGRRRRRQPAQADARPRRAARRRRHHARRVPQAHREGRRAGAPLPARARRRAVRRGRDRHPARPQGALRGPPRRAHPGLRAHRRRDAQRPLHRRPLPARQGHRPHRRGRLQAAHRDRLAADRDRRGRSPRAAARDRAHLAGQRDRRRERRAPRGDRARARRPARAAARP